MMTAMALRQNIISFPGLGIGDFKIDSVAFSIFGVSIAWYALFITLGMVLCVVYVSLRAREKGISYDHILDFAIWTILFGVLGARFYYVMTNLTYYDSFLEAINIREGGLAIYGGIIFGALTVNIVCLVKKMNFLMMADMIYPGVMLAQSIGRWGNFMNAEAHGGVTDLPWRMGINGVYYHPTFLYESLWNLLGFVLLNLFYKKKRYDGQIYFLGCVWYGFGRFLIESLRTDSMWMGPYSTQEFASLLLMLLAFAAGYLALKRILSIRENRKKLSLDFLNENKTLIPLCVGAFALAILAFVLKCLSALSGYPEWIGVPLRANQVIAAVSFVAYAALLIYYKIKKITKKTERWEKS